MSIIDALKANGHTLTEHAFAGRGYKRTEKGVVYTTRKADADKWLASLELDGVVLPNSDKKVIFAKGTAYEKASKKEIEEAFASGKIDGFICKDLYAEYYEYDTDEDAKAINNHGCSARSWAYIESVMKMAGIESIEEDENIVDFENVISSKSAIDATTYIGKHNNSWYFVAECMSSDAAVQLKIKFNHKPNEFDIENALQIRRFENKMCFRDSAEVFKCWECGHLMHWLDNKSGSLKEKLDRREDCFCGTCDKN